MAKTKTLYEVSSVLSSQLYEKEKLCWSGRVPGDFWCLLLGMSSSLMLVAAV